VKWCESQAVVHTEDKTAVVHTEARSSAHERHSARTIAVDGANGAHDVE
jgi:hypothetical protein